MVYYRMSVGRGAQFLVDPDEARGSAGQVESLAVSVTVFPDC